MPENLGNPSIERNVTQADRVISFVVDDAPLLQSQAWLLLHNLSRLAIGTGTAILLNHCGPLSPELHRKAVLCGALIRSVPRFGDGPAVYCNKLQQFETIVQSGARHAVLCDTDIGFLIDPCTLAAPEAVRAKPVDISNPPEPLLRQVLDRAGMADAVLDYHPPFHRELGRGRTHRLNCNGGLYVLPVALLRRLAPAWRKWARFCLDQRTLLGNTAIHSDQMGFTLAMIELGLPFEPLETACNHPMHFADRAYAGLPEIPPVVLHYHRRLQADGRIEGPAVPHIAAQVDRFNALVADARHDPDFGALLARNEAGAAA